MIVQSISSAAPLPVLLAVCLFLFGAPGASLCAAPAESSAPTVAADQPRLAEVWVRLAQRLRASGLYGPDVDRLLALLPPTPTQSPMGRKIRELYNKRFFPGSVRTKTPYPYYNGVVTQANAELCRKFIAEHKESFTRAFERYGVSPAIGSALLFVETRLGKVLGDVPENAFYTLASMAMSTEPRDISQWFSKLSGYQNHLPWLRETMRQRSDWAFREFRALVEHMIKDDITPERLPGSIYGAVGLCQFMPSNISMYGADGNGDGRIDLFNTADAIASMANYLAKHGWKKGISREQEHKLLMSYNHSIVYANTILALGELVADPRKTPADLAPVAKRKNRGKRQ